MPSIRDIRHLEDDSEGDGLSSSAKAAEAASGLVKSMLDGLAAQREATSGLIKSIVDRAAQQTMGSLAPQRIDMFGNNMASVIGAEIRAKAAEAEARQATIDARNLIIRQIKLLEQQNEILEQTLKETRADALRWRRRAEMLGVGLVLAVVAWLLNALNVAQVLSHLLPHGMFPIP